MNLYFSVFKLSIICLAFLFIQYLEVFSNDEYKPNTIVIKFKENSAILNRWLAQGRSGKITEFEDLLGNTSSKPYIRDAILNMINKQRTKLNSLLSNYHGNGLLRICILNYTNSIDPKVAATKLSGNPDIEYCEPLPIRKISFIPNDPSVNLQYYLYNIHAFDAWDQINTNDTVVVGVIDTGVDYNHEDLAANIWENPGETGLDSLGRDKRTNGVDDDGDGFIDDWRGWDFNSSTNPDGDNDPYPGHEHGTHVSGTIAAIINNGIGVAGVAKNVKIMIVKVGADDPNSGSIDHGYEGILYAAALGAKVINCSWGSSNYSQAEGEVVAEAVGLGAVISAAAGNDGYNVPYYPAAHYGVMSVAAVLESDVKAWFSNYNKTVDVSAPGVGILNTIPGNNYTYMDGTSMASPIAAGVAALVRLKFPKYNPFQVIEQVKATADNIDSLNPNYIGKIGRGRVNALRAVTDSNARSVILKNYQVTDADSNGVYEPGERISVNADFLNVLSSISGGNVKLIVHSDYMPALETDSAFLGNMATYQDKALSQPFSFIVPNDVPTNYVMDFEFAIYDSIGYINSETISMTFNPNYRTFKSNNISATFNSRGNIAYNDYPTNSQGDGFAYKNSTNLLYEGALMIGSAYNRVSDVARGSNQMYEDNSFSLDSAIQLNIPGKISYCEGFTSFDDSNSMDSVGVKVLHHIYQFNDDDKKDFIISVYEIINISGNRFDSLYAGLYFDWDIGPSGSNNLVDFDLTKGFGYAKNVKDTSLPLIGVMMLSGLPLNFWAMDNDGTTNDNPGVYDGFTKDEKWQVLTSGIGRKTSSITDASMIIGGGPIHLNASDTVRIAFSLFSTFNYDSLYIIAQKANETAKSANLSDGKYYPLPAIDYLAVLSTNNSDEINVYYLIPNNEKVKIDMFDALGNKVMDILSYGEYNAGSKSIPVNVKAISSGAYYIRMITGRSKIIKPVSILK